MKKTEIFSIYCAGLFQGIALVAFPAASSVFTSPHEFNLSLAAYGGLFIPQALLSIATSLLSSKLRKIRSLFLWGLLANLLAMVLLTVSATLVHHPLAYPILLVATSCLGIGFGFTVPSINTFASLFFPKKIDSAILILNALLGLGTALAPVFVAVFIGLGFWWGLPLMMSAAIAALLLFSIALQLKEGHAVSRTIHAIPKRFWLFAGCALLYGIVETVNGNWATVYMSTTVHAATGMASLALALFWAMITLGRLTFAGLNNEKLIYCILPFIVAASFLYISTNAVFSILKFALAGLGCSALLPLTISLGQHQLKSISTSVAGGIIAFYLLGYGIASFGVGALQGFLGLSAIFRLSAILAILLGSLSFLVSYRKT